MQPPFRDLFIDPDDQSALSFEVDSQGNGVLRSAAGKTVPVKHGIPRFVADEEFVESFGFQWNRFDVRRKEEDEAVFEVKTGVAPSDLAGKLVLDAGCGGGRYTRVAADHGAFVVGADRSRAVEKAQSLTIGMPNVQLVQADLTRLPFRPESFDLVFSIGVLHHSPDCRAAFDAVAAMVKSGGRLSVWLYRKNSWPQERINDAARRVARRLSRPTLLKLCRVGAALGGAPVLGQVFSKVVNVSTHPDPELRVCDTFDWYSPTYQSHHTPREVQRWFEDRHFEQIRELPPAKGGRMYRAIFARGWIPGSGVNVTGIRR
jgi:2-polyprenyl-3-methyl-5-hydroxy-6-metoxy-1,4-benzoquinol methylase